MKILSPILNISNKFNSITDENKIKPDKNGSFLHLSKKGIIKNISDDFCNATGYSKETLKGKKLSTFIFKSRKGTINNLINELSADAPFIQTKLKIIDAHNNIINSELFLTLTSLKEAAPVFAIFRISGTHQNKYTHLFEKKEKLRMLTENSNEVQVLFDTDMDCLYISPSCYHLTGFQYNEIINNDIHTFVHHDDLDKFWDCIKYATNHKESFIVIRIKRSDNTFVYVEGHIKTITDEFNCITHYALFIHDASHRIKHEQQLLKSKTEAEQANHLKNQFLTSVSHEFRTPLNAIIGFSRIMEKMSEDPNFNIYLKNIEISGLQLLDMVNNLLNFSKIEKEEMMTSITPIHVSSFFNSLSGKITENFPADLNSEVKITCFCETFKKGEFLYSDEDLLQSIFDNLISNAVKFTTEGYIKYGCKPYGIKNYLFYVEDTGVGISKKYQRNIFDTLTQQDGSLTRKYNGIGIGLAVTKKIIELLDGEIWVISEDGAGSAFYFTIPSRNIK